MSVWDKETILVAHDRFTDREAGRSRRGICIRREASEIWGRYPT